MNLLRSLKSLALITVVLIAGLVGALYLNRPKAPKMPFDLPAGQTEKMTVHIATGTLSFTKAKGSWQVQSEGVGPFKAKGEQVDSLLSALKKIEVEDVISEQGRDAADFQLSTESATVVTLLDQKAKELASGWFGKMADDAAHIYFRYSNSPTIYLARGSLSVSPDFTAWRDPVLLNAPEERVLTVLIEGPGFQTTLLRTSDTWSVNGNTIDPQPVWALVGTLAHLRTAEFVDLAAHPDLAADKLHYATVTLQLTEGPNQVLHIGPYDAKNKRYAASANDEPSVGWFPQATIQSLLKRPSDFHGTHRISRS